jgi:hypothetical protein
LPDEHIRVEPVFGPGEDETRVGMMVAHAAECVEKQIETLDRMETPEKHDEAGSGGDSEAFAEISPGLVHRCGNSVGHEDDTRSESEVCETL